MVFKIVCVVVVVVVIVVVVLGMDFDKGFVDTNCLGIRVASEGDSWVSNKPYTLNSVATSPATEANCLSYRS